MKFQDMLRSIFLGKRYSELKRLNDQVRYMAMNSTFMVASISLVILGIILIKADSLWAITDLALAFVLFVCLILLRSNVSFKIISVIPTTLFGVYCLYVLTQGTLYLWTAAWIFLFPIIAIFLCRMSIGLIQSIGVLILLIFIMYSPLVQFDVLPQIRNRFIITYILILSLTIIYEFISTLKDRKEAKLNADLAYEKDLVQIMKDNIPQGIFLMDSELKILPQYSKPLIMILSHYDSELAGRNFLDILSSSLDARQINTMKGYFSMVFAKSKSPRVLESANPISEFEYKAEHRVKNLSTAFHLIEQKKTAPVIIGIILDITREKELQREIQVQKKVKELEMKNMFDVIQIDPLVFQDFVEDIESNFNFINSILKDRTLTEKQVITKFFQNIHAIKSNAFVLGVEAVGKKLHALEDDIKAISSHEDVNVDDILELAIKLENLMQEKDSYTSFVHKIEAFRASNQIDSVFIHSMTKAVEKISAETQKKVDLKVGEVDVSILGSNLRKPIKDILFQCVRNSIYHGIEPAEDRLRKHTKPQGVLFFSIKKAGGRAEIIFSDDGRGLDWEKIKRKYLEKNPGAKEISKRILLSAIFLPEFSTAAEVSTVTGRGVGLSMVKDLVKKHNGTIQVESSDSGLLFKFSFPLVS
jgi:two-component system chemotaxis sensor kinase CheA